MKRIVSLIALWALLAVSAFAQRGGFGHGGFARGGFGHGGFPHGGFARGGFGFHGGFRGPAFGFGFNRGFAGERFGFGFGRFAFPGGLRPFSPFRHPFVRPFHHPFIRPFPFVRPFHHGFFRGFGHPFFGGFGFPIGVPVFIGGYYNNPYPESYPYPYPYPYPPVPPVIVVEPDSQGPQMIDYNQTGYSPPVVQSSIQEYGNAGDDPPAVSTPAVQEQGPIVFSIAMKNRAVASAVSYWVIGDTLHYLTPQGAHREVPLQQVNRTRSEKLNRARNVDFGLPNG